VKIKRPVTNIYLDAFNVFVSQVKIHSDCSSGSIIAWNPWHVNPLPQINYVAVNPVTNPTYPAPIAVLYFAFFPKATTVLE
jgi:hypothetical protein